MNSTFRYLTWKLKAKRAVAKNLTLTCNYCKEPIVPGDKVAKATSRIRGNKLVHAGMHFSISKKEAYCELESLANGIWDGHTIIPLNRTSDS